MSIFAPAAGVAESIRDRFGLARIITATNVFALIEDVHEMIESLLLLFDEEGVFVTESH